jgi:hypothetical protein
MRRNLLLICATAATFAGATAQAGDRYGADAPPAKVAKTTEWTGPLLSWNNKPDAVSAAAPVAAEPGEPVRAQPQPQPQPPQPLSDWARRANTPASVQPAQAKALPTSLYDTPRPAPAAAPQPVAAATPAPSPYHPIRPTGEVLTLSLADLPPPGPSLERQQAADEDAQMVAAQVARANLLTAQSAAAGKPVPTSGLLGGPQ